MFENIKIRCKWTKAKPLVIARRRKRIARRELDNKLKGFNFDVWWKISSYQLKTSLLELRLAYDDRQYSTVYLLTGWLPPQFHTSV